MSKRPLAGIRPEINPTHSPPLPRKSEGESSAVPQDRSASTPRLTREQKNEERGGDTANSDEVVRLRREVGYLSERLGKQEAEVVKLRREGEDLRGRCKRRDHRIAKRDLEIARIHQSYQEDAQTLTQRIQAKEERLERTEELLETRSVELSEAHARIARKDREIAWMRQSYKEDAQRQTQRIRVTEERLKQTEELLATRSAELSEAQAFLSTTDRLSEVEVLGIVRSLNENIYQVAVNLTEEWEKLESQPVTSRMDIDVTSRSRGPVLLQLARNRDPMGLTFLLQSCLCSMAVDMTSSWELDKLNSVYQGISGSGEHNAADPGQYGAHAS